MMVRGLYSGCICNGGVVAYRGGCGRRTGRLKEEIEGASGMVEAEGRHTGT